VANDLPSQSLADRPVDGVPEVALAPTVADVFVSVAQTSADLYVLLQRAWCLSSQGLADRTGVIVLLEQVCSAYRPANLGRPVPPGGDGPSLADEIGLALRQAGYLDAESWRAISRTNAPSLPWDSIAVERMIGEIGVVLSPLPLPFSDTQPVQLPGSRTLLPGTIACPTCHGYLPLVARFCGWCGQRLT
jgi:hypothetical protein